MCIRDRFYNKLSEHFHILAADNVAKAKMMADWKANVRSRWDAIEIKSIEAGNGLNATCLLYKSLSNFA